jgi:uncharacterized repeat protein (TIGR01451 family)
LVLAIAIAGLACTALLLSLAAVAPSVQAASPARPLAAIITGTVAITHTENTTHEMRVFGDGRITDRFLTDDGSSGGRNQIDQDSGDPYATTIAVLFDQHASTTNTVDVGVQGEFTMVTPITLNTSSDVPGYSEDTFVVYASRVLSYQIAQRTLATNTNNCVIMELVVRNTGGTALSGGKLLYMVDIDVAHLQNGDGGFYDPARRLVYLTDYNGGSPIRPGFAMGVSLLDGDMRGYAVNGVYRYEYIFPFPPNESYPTLDTDIRDEMITPTNSIADGSNDVVWLVANIPDLNPGEAETLAFGLCAHNASNEDSAAAGLIENLDRQTNLSVSKTAAPAAGGSVAAGERITYSVAISSTGYHYVDNVVVTDAVPTSTDLITYSVSQGGITASGGLITATVGRLDSTSGTVTVTLVVAPSVTITSETVISNQAFVRSEPIVTQSNVITHLAVVAATDGLVIGKTAVDLNGAPLYPGDEIEYRVRVTNTHGYPQTNVIIADPVPAHTTLVDGSLTCTPGATCVVVGGGAAASAGMLEPADFGGMSVSMMANLGAGEVLTLTFRARVNNGVSSIGGNVAVTESDNQSARETVPVYPPGGGTVESGLAIAKVALDLNGLPLRGGDIVEYRIVVTNANPTHSQANVTISDVLPAHTTLVVGSMTCSPGTTGGESGGVVTATLATLGPGDVLTLTFQVRVSDGASSIGGNVAAVESDGQNELRAGPVYPPGGEPHVYLPLMMRNY